MAFPPGIVSETGFEMQACQCEKSGHSPWIRSFDSQFSFRANGKPLCEIVLADCRLLVASYSNFWGTEVDRAERTIS